MSVLRLESPRPTSGQHLRPMRECTRICLARAARRREPVVLAMQHSILQTRRAQVEPRPSSSEHTAAELTSLQVFENNGRSLMPDSAIARVEKKRVRARAFLSHYTASNRCCCFSSSAKNSSLAVSKGASSSCFQCATSCQKSTLLK